MSASGNNGQVAKLGFKDGQVVAEFGYGDDVDDELRIALEDVVDGDLEDEDYQGIADAVLIWWREDDGDLTDTFVDAVSILEPAGFIVLVSPKVGRPGHVDPIDIAEAAATAGLNASVSVSLTSQWSATRLVAPKSGKR